MPKRRLLCLIWHRRWATSCLTRLMGQSLICHLIRINWIGLWFQIVLCLKRRRTTRSLLSSVFRLMKYKFKKMNFDHLQQLWKAIRSCWSSKKKLRPQRCRSSRPSRQQHSGACHLKHQKCNCRNWSWRMLKSKHHLSSDSWETSKWSNMNWIN